MAGKVLCPSSLRLHSSFMGCDRELAMLFTLSIGVLAAWLFFHSLLFCCLLLLPVWCAGMTFMRYLNHKDPLYFRVRLRLGLYSSPWYLGGAEFCHAH